MHETSKTAVFKKQANAIAQLKAENAQLRAQVEKLEKAPGA